MSTFNKVQKVETQMITEAFATVSTMIAEAEAYLKSIHM